MSRKAKTIWGIALAIVVLGLIGNVIGGGDEELQAAPAATTATTAAAVPTTEAPTPESSKEAAPAEDTAVYAQRIYDAWLTARGATSQTEVLAQSPSDVQGYLVSAESPVAGTVVFTAQLTKSEVTKGELKTAAMAVLQLVGYEDETVERVEIVTADDLVRGVANRRDSPLLNQ